MTTEPPAVRAVKRTDSRTFKVSTKETPDTAASPAAATIIVSAHAHKNPEKLFNDQRDDEGSELISGKESCGFGRIHVYKPRFLKS